MYQSYENENRKARHILLHKKKIMQSTNLPVFVIVNIMDNSEDIKIIEKFLEDTEKDIANMAGVTKAMDSMLNVSKLLERLANDFHDDSFLLRMFYKEKIAHLKEAYRLVFELTHMCKTLYNAVNVVLYDRKSYIEPNKLIAAFNSKTDKLQHENDDLKLEIKHLKDFILNIKNRKIKLKDIQKKEL